MNLLAALPYCQTNVLVYQPQLKALGEYPQLSGCVLSPVHISLEHKYPVLQDTAVTDNSLKSKTNITQI